MSARFEVVRTDAGHHARYVASNGRIVWTTEVYTRRSPAYQAILAITDCERFRLNGAAPQEFVAIDDTGRVRALVHLVDERGQS